MAETPVNPVETAQAAPTPPVDTTPPLTKFRATIQGDSKRGNSGNNVFTTDSLRSIIETAAMFNDAVTFLIDNEGIRTKVLDKARIALLDAMLPESVFANFEAHGVGYVTVDAKSLLAVLRRAKSKSVELRFEEGQLIVGIGGVRSFRIRTLEASEEEAPEPKTVHAASAVIDTELFKEALIDAKVMKADTIKLLAENGVLLFRALNETKGVEVRLGPAEGSASSTYTLDYLVKAAKAFGDGVVKVKFGNNTALELSTAFNEGYIRVYIAPRIE